MLSYPPTAMGADGDDYHGEFVADPYRWLEDTNSAQTVAWIAAQNELTRGWLAGCQDREAIGERLVKLADYPRVGVPFERGGRWFRFPQLRPPRSAGAVRHAGPGSRRAGRCSTRTRWRRTARSRSAAPRSPGDGTLLAYATSASGSDWQTWRVRDTSTGADLEDVVEWAKSDGVAWRKDKTGFYYMAPEPPAPGTEYLATSGLRRILFHRIGSPQADDEVVFAQAGTPGLVPASARHRRWPVPGHLGVRRVPLRRLRCTCST